MERVQRMKTATSPVRSAIVLGVTTALSLGLGVATLKVHAQEQTRTLATASHIPLAPDAPEQYVVKPGDTLWDISKVFLRDAWYWPEIWHINPQVQNPHRIYPGDTLTLTYVDGAPRLSVSERGERAENLGGATRLSPKVRSEPLSQAITSIPYDVVASFMGRPTILDKEQVRTAPYLVAMRDGHLIGAAGNEVYARGLTDPTPESRYSIVHVGEPLRDPDTNDVIGYTGLYVGAGPIVTAGEPAKLRLSESTREALQGDKLFPQDVDVPLDFVPRAPEKDVDGAIVTVQDLTVVGQYQVIAINRGSKDGLEPGHVLGVYQSGGKVRDTYSQGGLDAGRNKPFWRVGKNVQLPDERAGVVMIFKAYEQMSYALVMETTHEIRAGDRARNP
jgi:LysM repeat protein